MATGIAHIVTLPMTITCLSLKPMSSEGGLCVYAYPARCRFS